MPLLLGFALRAAPARAEPHEAHSRDGVLAVTLTAQQGKVRIGGLELPGETYNGDYAGPVLRVRPGDLLRIRLINQLPVPTNLHFHGIFTSPLGDSDNIHLSIAPNTAFTYNVRIPAAQPPGLYWYHSHIHGISEHQVMSGLSGALIVEAPDARDRAEPARTERLFVLKDMVFEDDTGDAAIDEDLHGVVQSINGEPDTAATMRPGETQLWRFSNQSANRPFHLSLRGHQFRVIAVDGEPSIGERAVDELDIMPAGRFDVLVTGGAPGRYDLVSNGMMTGTGANRRAFRILGHLDVAGPLAAPEPERTSPSQPPDLRAAGIDARRTIVFSQTAAVKPEDQRFFIDGRLFDASRVDVRVPLGHVEEWTVRNDSDDLHVFHIHQLGFQVVAVNGEPVPFTGRVDTVRVPERGEVTLRMAFTDPLITGQFVFHCHVLKHEDKGMMGMIEVYDPRPQGLREWAVRLYFHLWWWAHGVPWTLCGLSAA